LALLAVGLGLTLAAPTPAHAGVVPRSQALVAVLHDHAARARPNPHAHRIDLVQARRPLTRVRTVLPVLARAGRGDAWLRVRLPGRPNSHTGWISAKGTRSTSTGWRIRVSLSKRRVSVYRDGRGIRSFRAVIGKPSTPTPRGSFFIEEALAISSYEPGAPFALATSARSNALQEFEGGPGQIALHGTQNISGSLGTAVSHGCIRLGTEEIAWLARRIGAGVPLTIGR
jgi:lipoprotein-anchoring transpeptidase ErfK/SrfK